MLVPLFSVMYLILNFFISADIYLWVKTFRDPFRWKKAKIIFAAVYIILTSLIFIAYFLPNGETKTLFSRISNYYQGFLINLSITLAVAHLAAIVLKLFKLIKKDFFKRTKVKFISGWICAAVSVLFSLYGFINANNIQVTSYDVKVDKPGDDMKIILAADTHFGYSFGIKNMKQMVTKINELEPDLVCFAGDIFDNDYDAMDDPEGIKEQFASIKSTYGVYACWGNHDVSDKLFGGFTVSPGEDKKHDDRMEELLKDAGVKLLEDKAEMIDGKFTVIGRLDLSKPANDTKKRMDISEFKFDDSKLVIDIDHEPAELQETADAGIDLDLCGHTHNGQFFPLNVVINMLWENPAGYIKKTSENGHTMHNIVTEGVGVYGPFMRTFTNSEIVEINVDMK